MSPSDFKAQRLSRNEARKQISIIMNKHSENVHFSKHAIIEILKDGLTTTDCINVLKSPDAKIFSEGEFENGNFRYRLETLNIMVVVGFRKDGTGLNVVTAWDKRKKTRCYK